MHGIAKNAAKAASKMLQGRTNYDRLKEEPARQPEGPTLPDDFLPTPEIVDYWKSTHATTTKTRAELASVITTLRRLAGQAREAGATEVAEALRQAEKSTVAVAGDSLAAAVAPVFAHKMLCALLMRLDAITPADKKQAPTDVEGARKVAGIAATFHEGLQLIFAQVNALNVFTVVGAGMLPGLHKLDANMQAAAHIISKCSAPEAATVRALMASTGTPDAAAQMKILVCSDDAAVIRALSLGLQAAVGPQRLRKLQRILAAAGETVDTLTLTLSPEQQAPVDQLGAWYGERLHAILRFAQIAGRPALAQAARNILEPQQQLSKLDAAVDDNTRQAVSEAVGGLESRLSQQLAQQAALQEQQDRRWQAEHQDDRRRRQDEIVLERYARDQQQQQIVACLGTVLSQLAAVRGELAAVRVHDAPPAPAAGEADAGTDGAAGDSALAPPSAPLPDSACPEEGSADAGRSGASSPLKWKTNQAFGLSPGGMPDHTSLVAAVRPACTNFTAVFFREQIAREQTQLAQQACGSTAPGSGGTALRGGPSEEENAPPDTTA
ncbi:hypothetical protein ABPG75_006773 [Micractinium tetrahymenae]